MQHESHIEKQATAAHMEVTHAWEIRQDLEKWLSPADYSWHGKPVQAGTGNWFLQDDKTQAWMDSNNLATRIMWLWGIPGSGRSLRIFWHALYCTIKTHMKVGKTFLSTALVDHLRTRYQSSGALIISLFLRNGNEEINTSACILRTLIYLILQKHQPFNLPCLARQCQSQPLQSSSQLEDLLEVFLESVDRIFLVIDGLDEIGIEERNTLLSSILTLHGKSDNLRVLISSRNEADIADELSSYASLGIGNSNDGDIAAYTDFHGKEIIRKLCSGPHGRLAERTINTVLEKAKKKAKGKPFFLS